MIDREKATETPPGSGFVGLAMLGLACVGIFSSIAAYIALTTKEDFAGSGTLAIAAALSFGLLLNAIVRR